jgi:hypothetical protein
MITGIVKRTIAKVKGVILRDLIIHPVIRFPDYNPTLKEFKSRKRSQGL